MAMFNSYVSLPAGIYNLYGNGKSLKKMRFVAVKTIYKRELSIAMCDFSAEHLPKLHPKSHISAFFRCFCYHMGKNSHGCFTATSRASLHHAAVLL